MTTVRLWQRVDQVRVVAVRFIARITPSSCHGVVDDAG